MARCPECQAEQIADFGMTTCSKCSAVFMVGIDGQVESVDASVGEVDESSNDPVSIQPYEPQSDDFVETFESVAEEETPEEEAAQDDDQDAVSVDSIFDVDSAGANDDSNDDDNKDTEYSENFLENLSDNKVAAPSATDPLDIQRFDESSSSQMDDGEYVYEVVITGIDSADLKKDIMMALSEKRFCLIVSELQKEIQKGELVVRNLNPVRAMLIVLRLQRLDVIVEWRQKHFTQEASAKKSEAEV